MDKQPIRLVVEQVGPAYEAGIEDPSRHTGLKGYWGDTPQQAVLRMHADHMRGMRNLADALKRDAEWQAVITEWLAGHLGIELVNICPTGYEAREQFGQDQLSRLRARVAELEDQIDRLHRCPHGRRFGVPCVYCPEGKSIGGPLDQAEAAPVRRAEEE